ncbi:MAG TPA: glycosyltransferase [Tepidisphaeraceae bacterium]|nr:glycosyltransferase [Tepidisphaeraceae bacterium]
MSAVPAISVVMPVYNSGAYLVEALDSVLAQTLGDFELIAVDDGSTDTSLAILREYQKKDTRVRVISRPNTGIVGALNDGLAAARAPLIARMDGDDVCLPERFEKQIAFMAGHREHVLVGSQVMLMDGDGLPICPKPHTCFGHEQIDECHMNHGWAVVHPSIMVRREALERIGGYREHYKWVEDLDLFLRLAEMGKLENLNEILLNYRLHAGSVCQLRGELQSRLHVGLFHETRARRGLAPAQPDLPGVLPPPAEQHRMWAWWALNAGNVRTARRHALLTVRHAPLRSESWRLMACAVRGH